jgi:hypothetical protein
MDHKAPNTQKKSFLSGLPTSEDKVKVSLYYGACMGAIVFITLLVRWLVGIFKGL